MSLIDYLFPAAPPLFRTAQGDDAPALAALHGASFAQGWPAEEFERMLAERPARGHVAAAGRKGALLGFVLSHVVVPEAEILSIAVAESARGRGIGGALLTHHLSRLAAEGVSTSFLEVEEGNVAALKLYARIGYQQVGRRKGYYRGTDALLFRRDF
ncbi:ribosomal protein S18-alanine N-acetyltransferase [Xanthobacter agilis]|uniref:ribosomal protein S18-alanine N-acetyltransferase n=1 Tax=Xanthobacter agilis TaxID=47492 RepID=UPI00372A5D45